MSGKQNRPQALRSRPRLSTVSDLKKKIINLVTPSRGTYAEGVNLDKIERAYLMFLSSVGKKTFSQKDSREINYAISTALDSFERSLTPETSQEAGMVYGESIGEYSTGQDSSKIEKIKELRASLKILSSWDVSLDSSNPLALNFPEIQVSEEERRRLEPFAELEKRQEVSKKPEASYTVAVPAGYDYARAEKDVEDLFNPPLIVPEALKVAKLPAIPALTQDEKKRVQQMAKADPAGEFLVEKETRKERNAREKKEKVEKTSGLLKRALEVKNRIKSFRDKEPGSKNDLDELLKDLNKRVKKETKCDLDKIENIGQIQAEMDRPKSFLGRFFRAKPSPAPAVPAAAPAAASPAPKPEVGGDSARTPFAWKKLVSNALNSIMTTIKGKPSLPKRVAPSVEDWTQATPTPRRISSSIPIVPSPTPRGNMPQERQR
jgi:hypothetical protein